MLNPLMTKGLLKVYASYAQQFPQNRFLRDFFFQGRAISNTRYVSIETKRGGRTVSTSIQRGTKPPVVLARDGHKRSTYDPPYFSEQSPITTEDLETFSFGEDPLNPYDSATKALVILAEKRANIEKRFSRTEERQAAEALLTGKVEMFDGAFIQYETDDELVSITPGTPWSDEGADIIGDVANWAMAIFSKSGMKPDTLIIAPDVHSAMLKNEGVQKAMDIRNFQIGSLTSEVVAEYPEATFGGKIMISGIGAIDIIVYAGKYEDEQGNLEDYLPEGSFILSNKNNDGKMLYAATEGPGANGLPALIPGERSTFVEVADSIPAVASVYVSMAPLACPVSLDTWASGNVM